MHNVLREELEDLLNSDERHEIEKSKLIINFLRKELEDKEKIIADLNKELETSKFTASSNLNEELEALKLTISNLSEELENKNKCSICLTDDISIACNPCGHTYCDKCVYNSINCHMCRMPIIRTYKIYL